MSAERSSREVVYRAVLAPDKFPDGASWTVDDFRKFVNDCDAQGITGNTSVVREPTNDNFYGSAVFVAERKVSLLCMR
jgi:hypothetical protein